MLLFKNIKLKNKVYISLILLTLALWYVSGLVVKSKAESLFVMSIEDITGVKYKLLEDSISYDIDVTGIFHNTVIRNFTANTMSLYGEEGEKIEVGSIYINHYDKDIWEIRAHRVNVGKRYFGFLRYETDCRNTCNSLLWVEKEGYMLNTKYRGKDTLDLYNIVYHPEKLINKAIDSSGGYVINYRSSEQTDLKLNGYFKAIGDNAVVLHIQKSRGILGWKYRVVSVKKDFELNTSFTLGNGEIMDLTAKAVGIPSVNKNTNKIVEMVGQYLEKHRVVVGEDLDNWVIDGGGMSIVEEDSKAIDIKNIKFKVDDRVGK